MVQGAISSVLKNRFLPDIAAFALVWLARSGLTLHVEGIRRLLVEDVGVDEGVGNALADGFGSPAVTGAVAHLQIITIEK